MNIPDDFFSSETWLKPRMFSRAEASIDIFHQLSIGENIWAVSIRFLSLRWRWSTYAVRTFLENEEYIDVRIDRSHTEIALKNPVTQKEVVVAKVVSEEPTLFPSLRPEEDPLSFDNFWNKYDKKVGKGKCEKLYANLSLAERRDCIEYLPKYICAIPDKNFRKNPETFLRNKSWNDEIVTKTFTKSGKTDTILHDNSESRFENQMTW